MFTSPIFTPYHLLRFEAFLASPPETRREMILTYEMILRTVKDDEIPENVRGLLDTFWQEYVVVCQEGR